MKLDIKLECCVVDGMIMEVARSLAEAITTHYSDYKISAEVVHGKPTQEVKQLIPDLDGLLGVGVYQSTNVADSERFLGYADGIHFNAGPCAYYVANTTQVPGECIVIPGLSLPKRNIFGSADLPALLDMAGYTVKHRLVLGELQH